MAQMAFERYLETIRPGVYRHYKGNLYEVIGVARHSETEEPVVVYRALYGGRGLWVRPAHMWDETVERDGKAERRFVRVDGPQAAQAVFCDESRVD